MEKTCCKCYDKKNIELFIKQKSNKDGYSCVCKSCKQKY